MFFGDECSKKPYDELEIFMVERISANPKMNFRHIHMILRSKTHQETQKPNSQSQKKFKKSKTAQRKASNLT